MADIRIDNHGSIFVVHGVSAAGKEWLQEHIPDDAQTWCGGIVVEHRYVHDIALGAACDDLEVV